MDKQADAGAASSRREATSPSDGGGRFPLGLMHAAATMYYVKDATQADVARSLGVSRATVSRLIAEARRLGIVRIEVMDLLESPPPDLAEKLAEALHLEAVYVAPSAHPSVLRSSLAVKLGEALVASGLGRDDVLLVSSGRTVWEVGNEALPALAGTVVVPMVGGQHEPEAWYQTNEITRMFAQGVSGHPMFLYAPALPGPDLYDRLLQDPGINRVLQLWSRATCAVVGVGAPPSTRASMPGFVPRDAAWLPTAAGDICTRFFDEAGQELTYPGSERLVATTYEAMHAIPHTIAVATGLNKLPSLTAGARTGWFNTLVTDTPTALGLLEQAERS